MKNLQNNLPLVSIIIPCWNKKIHLYMNIWIFNHYATKPDEPATREYDIGKELVKRGHQITIFASSFSHYKFKEKYLAKGEKWKTENYEGVNFIWIRTFPYQKMTGVDF